MQAPLSSWGLALMVMVACGRGAPGAAPRTTSAEEPGTRSETSPPSAPQASEPEPKPEPVATPPAAEEPRFVAPPEETEAAKARLADIEADLRAGRVDANAVLSD